MIITKIDGEYIIKMVELAENKELEINRVCSDCDEEFREGEFRVANKDHGLLQLNDEVEWIKTWTLIIGCLGFHEMDDEGKAKNK